MDVRVGLWRRLSAEELMLLNCGVGEDSWEFLGLQGDPTSPFWRRSALGFLWKEWCWSWNSSNLVTSSKELTHWKRLWCWEGLRAGGERDDRGWDGWMASLTQWTWVWVNSASLWWTGRPGVPGFMGSQRVGHDWATELNWTELNACTLQCWLWGSNQIINAHVSVKNKVLTSRKCCYSNFTGLGMMWSVKPSPLLEKLKEYECLMGRALESSPLPKDNTVKFIEENHMSWQGIKIVGLLSQYICQLWNNNKTTDKQFYPAYTLVSHWLYH